MRTSTEPYFDTAAWQKNLEECRELGFKADPILSEPQKYLGLNLALCWPFPGNIRVSYEKLETELHKLDDGLWVYPYQQTHITLMTLFEFKSMPNPSDSDIESFNRLTTNISERLSGFFLKETSLELDIGAPILSRGAIFLPIHDKAGWVQQTREKVASELEEAPDIELIVPNIAHSTIARFKRVPKDPNAFIEKFERLASDTMIDKILINEILLTTEPEMYMTDGEILHRFPII